jgi:polysaccharide pyruvyl transferase WcaK-like protein
LRELGAVDAAQFSRVMSEYDAVVVSRFHSVVLALRTGIPFVAVDPYWTPRTGTSKVHELLTDVRLPHRRIDADTDLAALLSDVLTGDGPEPAAYRRMHERAQRDFDVLADRIRGATS